MIVIVIKRPRAALRGMLSRWLLEVSRGVFVGRPSALVRERLWSLTIGSCKDALLLSRSKSEQGFSVVVHGNDPSVLDHEGLFLQKLR